MIHIRSGKVPVNPSLFNEAFMMHTSTSPQYSIIASTDVSAKMMADSGEYLTDESLVEAVAFRQAMARLQQEIAGPQEGRLVVRRLSAQRSKRPAVRRRRS